MCVVCGKEFFGTEGRNTCGGSCRTKMSRLRQRNKKPEYWILAKSNGQKMPNFDRQPEMYRKEKKPQIKTEIISSVKFEKPIIEIPPVVKYEKPISEIPKKELTVFEKIAHNADIDRKIKTEKDKSSPPGIHPRMFRLQQDDIVKELEKQKYPV